MTTMERLLRFRSEHPYKQVNVAGIQWQYIFVRQRHGDITVATWRVAAC